MIANLAAPASAILAAGDRHAATATNVANVSNDKAPRQRVDLAAAPPPASGVTATTRTMAPGTGSLVDDVADMSLTGVLYGANLAVLRTQDETVGTLLDVFA